MEKKIDIYEVDFQNAIYCGFPNRVAYNYDEQHIQVLTLIFKEKET